MNIFRLATFRRAKKKTQPSIVTGSVEFQHEFGHTTDRLLRKRFFWFCVVLGGLQALGFLVVTGTALVSIGTIKEISQLDLGIGLVFSVVQMLACFLGAFAVKRVKMDRAQMIRASQWLVIIVALADFTGDALVTNSPWTALLNFMLIHVIACLVLPWTPRQALVPAFAVLALFAATEIARAILGHNLLLRVGDVKFWFLLIDLLAVFAALPGLLICWLRSSQRMKKFKMGFLQDRYSDMRRELYGAQQIHESIFPDEVLGDTVEVRYEYQPMRQIGGDFLFLPPMKDGDAPRTKTHAVMIDVTGHGIGAALTVNRLHGELERLFAEHPNITPDEVMRKINRYIHLTLAIHSVYATGVAMTIDHESCELHYASAGHPPSFLRGVDGTLEDLESTGLLLGVSHPEDYIIGQSVRTFGPGDTLIAYTDGVIECRDEKNRMIGIDGLRKTLAGRTGSATYIETIISMVDDHRAAVANDDDVLVVEITRSLSSL